jgi:hypothetical protein
MIGIIKKIYGLIDGGSTGDVLTKKSNTNYDVEWTTPSAGAQTVDAVLPTSLADQSILSNSYDYYMNHYCKTNITIQSLTYSIRTNGSDPIRFGIYRGADTTATLVGETASISAGSRNTGLNQVNITAVSGQNLTFSAGEPLVIAIASGGTTTYFNGCATPNTNTITWYNTTDSEAGGFPPTPRAKTGARSTVPALEINPYSI